MDAERFSGVPLLGLRRLVCLHLGSSAIRPFFVCIRVHSRLSLRPAIGELAD